MKKKNQKGFTLVEVFVLVIIILIIGSVVVGKVVQHNQGSDKVYHINR